MFTPRHCTLAFPTFGTLPGHISPSSILSLTQWHTPLFSLFVWSCLDYWNVLLLVGLLTNTINWLQLGQSWWLSLLPGTRKGRQDSKSARAATFFITKSRFPSCHNYPSLTTFSILRTLKHSLQSHNMLWTVSFLNKSTRKWGKKKNPNFPSLLSERRVGKQTLSDFCSTHFFSNLEILPRSKSLSTDLSDVETRSFNSS